MVHRSTLSLLLLIGLIPRAQAQAPGSMDQPVGPQAMQTGPKTYTVPAGTRIPLSLKNEISTRLAAPGDPVYLVSDFPIVEDGAVVLPAGMYVRGVVDSVQRPGKVKGRAQLHMHFTSMIFPNGVEIPLPGSLEQLPDSNGAHVKRPEGTVEQAGNKGRDAQRIATTTLEGTGVGGVVGYGVGNVAKGTAIGAGTGAAIGVLTTLLTRGNDVVIPAGTNLEMVLSRPVVLQQAQLVGMPASTGIFVPGPAPAQPLTTVTSKPNN